MILCDKLSEENIRCSIVLSNDEETIMLHWNGEDFVGSNCDSQLYEEFDNTENIMMVFKECLERGVAETPNYKVEII